MQTWNGIKVYMDMVFNHTSLNIRDFKSITNDLKYQNIIIFIQKRNDTIRYKDWEIFINLKTKMQQINDIPQILSRMPDLNLDNFEVIEELKAIQKYWTN
ncbi:alpha-amylase family glycosyl hydrolase [Mesomycoplasma neurolyticum]|nr:alpha-amylase family glycosyl hydrolase [Mesomycoplasma neurolyticum]